MFSVGHLKEDCPGVTAASLGSHELTHPNKDLQHPVLTTQICLNAKYSTESPDFSPENVETGHRQGKAPCRHAHCCYSRLCHQMNGTFLTRKYHQLFFTYYSALSVSMETMAKSRDGKKGIICCA